MREVGSGLLMAFRRWPRMIPLGGMIAVGCAVLSLGLGGVFSQVPWLRGVRQLSERQAVTFAAYYPHGPTSVVGEDAVQYLLEMIDRREAYAAVVHNMRIVDPSFAGGHQTMVLFGDVASDFFPELQPAEPTPLPFALRGAKLAGQNIDSLNLDGESIPVVRALLAGATFFDVKAGVFSLDERIVIRAPARMLRLLLPIERDEAFSRAVMLAPADAAVDAYVSRGARGGLFLVPHDVAAGREQMVRESLMAFVMYIVAMLGFLALVLTAFLSFARLTIRQEMAGFRIQAASGAAVVRIGLKIGSFVAAVVLFLPVALLSSLVLVGGAIAAGAVWVPGVPWVLLALVLVYVCMCSVLVRDVLVQSRIVGSA